MVEITIVSEGSACEDHLGETPGRQPVEGGEEADAAGEGGIGERRGRKMRRRRWGYSRDDAPGYTGVPPRSSTRAVGSPTPRVGMDVERV